MEKYSTEQVQSDGLKMFHNADCCVRLGKKRLGYFPHSPRACTSALLARVSHNFRFSRLKAEGVKMAPQGVHFFRKITQLYRN
jgi:hypothetical protein